MRRYIWVCSICEETFTTGQQVNVHGNDTGHRPITGEKYE